MDTQELIKRHPVLWHMADARAEQLINQHGLLSTAVLLDLFEVDDAQCARILGTVRRSSIQIKHPVHGSAIIRDQTPLIGLEDNLADGTTAQQFLDALNSRVFLWADQDRLTKLLNSSRYRPIRQTVFSISTAELLKRHGERVQLSAFNSGAIPQGKNLPRDARFFTSPEDFPGPAVLTRRSSRKVAEVTVLDAIPDLAELTTATKHWQHGISLD
ncbi:hypothetical protein P3T37_004261 [Kitasatospora sp. MAA4]|uniref:DUF7002 family protein n=1 Tax=Kitasatospora sp. MAA4 TaxID=3035093 RepID=UPI00247650BC|nr:hypothetical protein [Kitasatospora sp. MAA4]MDH6134852.1 hypothetical protein [Kitasatospora sp. MAA4]